MVNKRIENACNKKNNLYKAFLNSNKPESESKYKIYKNKLTTILRKAEKDYYSNKLLEVKGNMKNTWKVLKSVINKSSRNKKPHSSFNYNC